MAKINVDPKSQRQLSQDTIKPYSRDNYNSSKTPENNLKKRELQRSVKDEKEKKFSIGLRDIDEAIFYYFNNVIKPTVKQNSTTKNVPILYGSPERWKAVQSDGFYRDRHGKIQLPLILIKRDSIEKNRNLGNKIDANNPLNFEVINKKYSSKNRYDRFSVLNNRKPVDQYQAIVIPDYVNITYSCMIFTEYIEQMNKLIESINYASDSYWGDKDKFNFRAMVDNYTTVTELVQGRDRTVKTEFNINLLGHLVPEAFNTLPQGVSKYFTKAQVKFGVESVKNIDDI